MSTATSSNGLNASGSSPRIRIGRDANVEVLGQKPVAGNPDVSPMGEASQPAPVIVKQVDHNALQGSNMGDHRAPNTGETTTDQFKNQAGPRGETGTKGA